MMKRLLLLLFCFLSVASAHSYLETSTPAEGETVMTLTPVTLEFTENVQVKFSFFKVYKLTDTGNLSDETERLKLNGQASTLASDVVTKMDDEAERANSSVSAEGDRATTIMLELKEDLTPGIYVVMWRLLSVDTHSTQGFYLFQYDPEN